MVTILSATSWHNEFFACRPIKCFLASTESEQKKKENKNFIADSYQRLKIKGIKSHKVKIYIRNQNNQKIK